MVAATGRARNPYNLPIVVDVTASDSQKPGSVPRILHSATALPEEKMVATAGALATPATCPLLLIPRAQLYRSPEACRDPAFHYRFAGGMQPIVGVVDGVLVIE